MLELWSHWLYQNFIVLHCLGFALRAKMGQRGKKIFFAFLCVSEHFESIMRHIFFFENFRERKAQNACQGSEQDVSANMLCQTVTLVTAIFLLTKIVRIGWVATYFWGSKLNIEGLADYAVSLKKGLCWHTCRYNNTLPFKNRKERSEKTIIPYIVDSFFDKQTHPLKNRLQQIILNTPKWLHIPLNALKYM